jgi:hypothetical protein
MEKEAGLGPSTKKKADNDVPEEPADSSGQVCKNPDHLVDLQSSPFELCDRLASSRGRAVSQDVTEPLLPKREAPGNTASDASSTQAASVAKDSAGGTIPALNAETAIDISNQVSRVLTKERPCFPLERKSAPLLKLALNHLWGDGVPAERHSDQCSTCSKRCYCAGERTRALIVANHVLAPAELSWDILHCNCPCFGCMARDPLPCKNGFRLQQGGSPECVGACAYPLDVITRTATHEKPGLCCPSKGYDFAGLCSGLSCRCFLLVGWHLGVCSWWRLASVRDYSAPLWLPTEHSASSAWTSLVGGSASG